MKIKNLNILLLFSYISYILCDHMQHSKSAMVISPVADLVTNPEWYRENIPHSYLHKKLTDARVCPRVHQLVYGTIVSVVSVQKEYLLVKVPHACIIHNQTIEPITYWTHKKHIKILDTPVSPDTQITLIKPWYDNVTQQTYPIGSRFIRTAEQLNKQHIKVQIFDDKNNTITTYIPYRYILTVQNTERNNKKQHFLQLLHKWAHPPKGKIPYVWGGYSIGNTCPLTEIIALQKKLPHGFDYEHEQNLCQSDGIKMGLDCSGMIHLAAQLSGIPYYAKNSSTAAHMLEHLQPHEQLSIGDLLWMPGHIVVISNLKPLRIIEARSYAHGYGYIHEAPINHIFTGIHSTNDLISHYHQKKSLIRIDKSGNVCDTFPNWHILKLDSCWNTKT